MASPAGIFAVPADPGTERAIDWAGSRHRQFVSELAEFVRFPAVGAQPRHTGDMRRCAAWLARHLAEIGLEHAAVLETGGAPVVYADWLRAPERPTVLVYGHYDVQPAEPLDQWRTPPFEPAVRARRLYGRGASDDKGQLFVHVKSAQSWLAANGALPVNIRFLIEGEEETGSAHLEAFLQKNRIDLEADIALVSDSPMAAGGAPAITYSLRGALSAEVRLRGPARDLHSGAYGGAVLNPLQAMCGLIASMHDSHGRVTIPGFYNSVEEQSPEERDFMAASGPSDEQVMNDARIERSWGEPGYSLYERITTRPALTVNGIVGGYAGAGAKAVIPASATAKLNLRLAPGQDPHAIAELLAQHAHSLTPAGLRVTVKPQMFAKPVVIDRRLPVMRAAAAACERGFGRSPIFLRAGGTIPVVSMLVEQLGLPVVLIGFAQADDGLHAPDESFSLDVFRKAIITSIAFMARLKRM